jgi:hypothetical protein
MLASDGDKTMRMRLAIGALCALAAALALSIDGSSVLSAWSNQCDFTTGGGYIYPQGQMTGNKANFAIAGGCKHTAFWGHLEYQDKAFYVKAHSNTVTGYEKVDDKTRLICGEGKTKEGVPFSWVVRVKDMGEPGNQDEFDIQMTGGIDYSTAIGAPHKLGGGTRGGGNIQLHKPNPSTSGYFSVGKCPPVAADTTVTVTALNGGGGTVTGPDNFSCDAAAGPHGSTNSTTCSAQFTPATTITLTAHPDPDNSVVAFTGCTQHPENLNMCDFIAPGEVTVTFSLVE